MRFRQQRTNTAVKRLFFLLFNQVGFHRILAGTRLRWAPSILAIPWYSKEYFLNPDFTPPLFRPKLHKLIMFWACPSAGWVFIGNPWVFTIHGTQKSDSVVPQYCNIARVLRCHCLEECRRRLPLDLVILTIMQPTY